jgi:hypothetical protein
MSTLKKDPCEVSPIKLDNALYDYKKLTATFKDPTTELFLKIIDELRKIIYCRTSSRYFNNVATKQIPCDQKAKVWVFDHNLNSDLVLIQTYDENFNQLIPETIILNNDNTATITFSFDACGYIIGVSGDISTSGTSGTGTSGTSGSSGAKGSAGSSGLVPQAVPAV